MAVLSVFHRIPCLRRQVVVNLTDGTTAIQGVLWATRGPWLVLKQASLLQTGRPPAPMDGETIVDRAKVQFLQAL